MILTWNLLNKNQQCEPQLRSLKPPKVYVSNVHIWRTNAECFDEYKLKPSWYVPGRPLSSCPCQGISGSGNIDICCAGAYQLYSSCLLGMHMTSPCVLFSWKSLCNLHSWKKKTTQILGTLCLEKFLTKSMMKGPKFTQKPQNSPLILEPQGSSPCSKDCASESHF